MSSQPFCQINTFPIFHRAASGMAGSRFGDSSNRFAGDKD